jgi:hypothetical protein
MVAGYWSVDTDPTIDTGAPGLTGASTSSPTGPSTPSGGWPPTWPGGRHPLNSTTSSTRYERHHNQHRLHRGIANARPLHTLPEPITDPDLLTHLNVHRNDRLGGLLHEYRNAA